MPAPSIHLVRDWQDHLQAEGRAEKTIAEYAGCVLRFLVASPSPEPTEATEANVVVYLVRLSAHGPSRQLHMKALRSFYRWAHQQGHMAEDPTRNLHPKAPPAPPADAYTPEEVTRIVAAARVKDPKRAFAILACYGLGLRRQEIARLMPSDLDFERRRVLVRLSKGGKTRWVAMSDTAERALRELRPWFNGTILGSVKPETFSAWVSEAAEAAGLPKGRRRAHMLRSAYATQLRRKGARIEVVQALLGHSSIATTQRYFRVDEDEMEQAAGLL